MALNLQSLTSSVKNLFVKNNTTTATYDISNGLKKRIQMIKIGDASIYPIPNNLYPALLVELKSKTSEFSQLGNSAKRLMVCNFDIIPITYYGLGQAEGQEDSLKELYLLSSNVERLVRNYPQLSLTSQVLQADCTDVRYEGIRSDNTYVQTSKINLQVQILEE